jgi:hypothetical protein
VAEVRGRGTGLTYDLLLEWTSERGGGTLSAFRQAHDWLMNRDGGTSRPVIANRTAAVMAVLGHLEVDWVGGEWCAAPPVLTIIPYAGGRALLTGARTRTLLDRLAAETADDVTMNVIYAPYPQSEAPAAIYLVAESETDIEGLARRLRIRYEYSVSERLSELLPSLTSYLSLSGGSPAARGFEVEKFSDRSLGWTAVESDQSPGLYRYNLYGRPEFRFVTSAGRSFTTDKAIGVFAELARTRRRVIAFSNESPNGTLIVPVGVPLPVLHARAAAMCTGLAPQFDWNTLTVRYRNVPLRIAERIATSLGQDPLLPTTTLVRGVRH